MKKLLVCGSNGMAGHTISDYLKSLNKYEIINVARSNADYNLDIEFDLNYLKDLIKTLKPDVVINCIGLLVKASNDNPERAIYINSYFPKWLEKVTKNTQTKIIHLSTDCVFNGLSNGNYIETDIPTETNNYGRTKSMGELNNSKNLTLRLSIIGDEEKSNGVGLFEWFMRQKGDIKGYSNVLWNGITTLELAKQIDEIINLDINLVGLYHLAPSFNISKFDLLYLIKEIFEKEIAIGSDPTVIQDKTLHNSRTFEYNPLIPSYEQQLMEMKEWLGK
ncbi:MAG: SDR family oxidoreductase [Patescibacteria group bacterium]